MHTRLVPVDHSRMALLANFLVRCPTAEKFYSDRDMGWKGAAGSNAAAERNYGGPEPAKPWDERVLLTACASARIQLTAMAEQALSMARLITDPELGVHGILAVDVCSRSAIEIGARVFRFVDPSYTPLERVCHHLVEQLYSANQAERLASDMEITEPVNEIGISSSTAQLKERCSQLGLVVGGTGQSPTVNGLKRTTATTLVRSLVEATPYRESKGMVYNVLSASSHGTQYSLLRGFVPTDDVHEGEPVMIRAADHRVIEASVGLTMVCFVAVLQRVVGYLGWDHWRVTSLTNMMHSMLSDGPR